MSRIKNGVLTIVKALKFEEQTLLEIPENRVMEVISNEGTAGKAYITVMAGEGNAVPTRKEIPLAGETQFPIILDELIANIAAVAADLKVNYATGELDTEAKILVATNATNTKVNAIATALNTLTAALVTAGIMAKAG